MQRVLLMLCMVLALSGCQRGDQPKESLRSDPFPKEDRQELLTFGYGSDTTVEIQLAPSGNQIRVHGHYAVITMDDTRKDTWLAKKFPPGLLVRVAAFRPVLGGRLEEMRLEDETRFWKIEDLPESMEIPDVVLQRDMRWKNSYMLHQFAGSGRWFNWVEGPPFDGERCIFQGTLIWKKGEGSVYFQDEETKSIWKQHQW